MRPAGRLIGRLCGLRAGYGFFSIGKIFALLLIPFAMGLFVVSLLPGMIERYKLTNRRVIVQRGLRSVDDRWVDFDRFDAIDIEVLPGQEWFPAGDLVFRRGAIETFRLAGVSRPESFRHTCLAARRGYLVRGKAGKSSWRNLRQWPIRTLGKPDQHRPQSLCRDRGRHRCQVGRLVCRL